MPPDDDYKTATSTANCEQVTVMEHEHSEPPDESSSTATSAEASDPRAAEVSDLQKQRDDYYDRLLRKTAEFDNYRKRTERERLQSSETAAADLIEELLPMVDDMERALKADAGSEGADSIRRGVELIYKRLVDTLRKRGVKPIEALGADFDPHFHQAVSHEPAEGRRDGEVIEEFRRGYMLGDRLLRPAMVKVAKA
jgi:molecular chaperone GrpE